MYEAGITSTEKMIYCGWKLFVPVAFLPQTRGGEVVGVHETRQLSRLGTWVARAVILAAQASKEGPIK